MAYKKLNNYLNSLPVEEIETRSKEDLEKAKKDFQELKDYLSKGKCNYCGQSISHFSEKKPCFHWLLKPKGFKKRHFPLLFKDKSFHQINAYLRWVANSELPIQNINDISGERLSNKIIEETIKYKNLEWSFCCSKNDMEGHKDKYKGREPHYHFQMKIDNLVIINYNGFHIPFNDYDNFCFAVEHDEFDRLKSGHIISAGMQSMFDNFSPEELLEKMHKSPENSPEKEQFSIDTLISAKKGTTISGDELADIIDEHKKTGIPMAKLLKKLENVNMQTFISPGPAVPEKSIRTPHRKK